MTMILILKRNDSSPSPWGIFSIDNVKAHPLTKNETEKKIKNFAEKKIKNFAEKKIKNFAEKMKLKKNKNC
jgi:hypothetical protein